MRGVVRSGPRRKVTAPWQFGSLNFVTKFTLRNCRSARRTFPYAAPTTTRRERTATGRARVTLAFTRARYFGPAFARTSASTPDAGSSVTVYGGVKTLVPRRSPVIPLVP